MSAKDGRVMIVAQAPQAAVAVRLRRRRVRRRLVYRALTYAAMGLVVSLFVIPFVWLIVTSLKTPDALLSPNITWIPHPVYAENYASALTTIPFLQYLANTLVICLPNVLGTVLSCSLAAYALACIRWPGRAASFGLVLATMMLPYPVTIIPLYLVFRALGWLHIAGGYLPLIVPSLFGAPFFIFLLRQFFASIPGELT